MAKNKMQHEVLKPKEYTPVAEYDAWFYLRPIWDDVKKFVDIHDWEEKPEAEAQTEALELLQKIMPALVRGTFLSQLELTTFRFYIPPILATTRPT